MLNIIELEQRWLRYKIKSFIPHAIIVISLTIIAIVLFSFSSNNTSNQKTVIPSNNQVVTKINEEPIKEVISIEEVVVKEEKPLFKPKEQVSREQQTETENSQKVKLSPSLDFMKRMQNSVQPYYQNETADENYETDKKQSRQKKVTAKIVTPKKEPVSVPSKQNKHHIQIKRQNTQNDIYDIIKRFKKNDNPALSLFVAKKYYELGNYRQAYNYALMTNRLNKDIESSWIVFAKSLVKLGKREKAIKTLKKYITQSQSSSAQILLDEIESGKFR